MVSRRVWAAPAPASPRPISAVATVGSPRTSRMVPSQTWMSDVIHTSPACKGQSLPEPFLGFVQVAHSKCRETGSGPGRTDLLMSWCSAAI